MKLTKKLLATFSVLIAIFAAQVTFGQNVSAACANKEFLGIPNWSNGLLTNDCKNVMSPTEYGGLQPFVTKIAQNILQMLFAVVGYIALGFVLLGSFKILVSNGNPDALAKGRSTILRALVGMIISVSAYTITGQVAWLFNDYTNEQNLVKNIVNLVISVGAAVTVLMIVINGFRITTSGDNPDSISKARKAIISAVVGLILLILSAAIVNFVLGRL